MTWTSVSTQDVDAPQAFQRAVSMLSERGIREPQAIFFFVASGDERAVASDFDRWLTDAYPGAAVIGASAAGVVGQPRRTGDALAVSVMALESDGARCTPFWIPEETDPHELHRELEAMSEPIDDLRGIMLLADPFTVDIERMLQCFDGVFSDVPVFGGLLSGSQSAGQNSLTINGEHHRSGTVAVLFSGELQVDVIVAQGCRAIGEPYIITERRGNLVDRLDRGTPLDVLRTIAAAMDPPERQLLMHSLFVGLNMRDDACVECSADDFLIRNILGIDPDSGSMAIGAIPEKYQVMQFHVRDGASAEQELERLLDDWTRRRSSAAAAVLQFSCMGRSEQLFGTPDHDRERAIAEFGTNDVSGFFCSGEIGPVGARTYLHGYTTTFAVFSPSVD